jgi:hypothetical protein
MYEFRWHGYTRKKCKESNKNNSFLLMRAAGIYFASISSKLKILEDIVFGIRRRNIVFFATGFFPFFFLF